MTEAPASPPPLPVTASRRRRALRWLRLVRSRESGLSVALALQMSVMFGVAPLAATGVLPSYVVEAFRVVLAAAAVLLIAPNRYFAWTVGAAMMLSLALSAELHSVNAVAGAVQRLVATTVFDGAIAVLVVRRVFGPGQVTVHRITGAVILYLSLALIFASAYRACALFLHPSFNVLPSARGGSLSTFLYFSLSTLTTTGFGDIAPVHPFIRSLANLEAVIGQLFPATLLARLVSLHAARDTPAAESEG